MYRFLAVALAIVLSGCFSAYYEKHVKGNEKSPLFKVPVDSKFVLNQELTVKPKRKWVHFQNAKILRRQDVNRYIPYCALELHTKKDIAQRVTPDRFVVHKVFHEDIFYVAQGERVQVAQLDQSNGQTYQAIAMVMELFSEKQPDVLKLICVEWGLPQDIAYITIRMIRRILSDIFILELADASARPGPRIRRESPGPGY